MVLLFVVQKYNRFNYDILGEWVCTNMPMHQNIDSLYGSCHNQSWFKFDQNFKIYSNNCSDRCNKLQKMHVLISNLSRKKIFTNPEIFVEREVSNSSGKHVKMLNKLTWFISKVEFYKPSTRIHSCCGLPTHMVCLKAMRLGSSREQFR